MMTKHEAMKHVSYHLLEISEFSENSRLSSGSHKIIPGRGLQPLELHGVVITPVIAALPLVPLLLGRDRAGWSGVVSLFQSQEPGSI